MPRITHTAAVMAVRGMPSTPALVEESKRAA
jgi:hypothetical protein